MKRFLKSFHHGHRGFTLIELLVVVAILGVLAAIAIPNVAKFIGTGTVEAANTEAADVQLAVVAYMADGNRTTFDGTVGPTVELSPHPGDFLMNQGGMQAVYHFVAGEIDIVSDYGSGKWQDLTWDVATKTWEKSAPATP